MAEGAFVLMLGHFLILAPVVGLVFQVELAQAVGPQNRIVAQVDVADLGQARVLRDEATGRPLLPRQADVLSQRGSSGKRVISTISAKMPAVITGPRPLTVSKGLGNGAIARAICWSRRLIKRWIIRRCSALRAKVAVSSASSCGSIGIRRAQRVPDRARRRRRIVKAAAPAMGDQVGQFERGHRLQLGDGELGQQGQAGGAVQISEGLDALPIAALEKGIGLEAQFLARQVAGQ